MAPPPPLHRFIAVCFLLVIIVLGPSPARGSRHKPQRPVKGRTKANEEVGLCSSSVTPYGYECQEFQVQTKDGYILGVQRIPQGRGGGGNSVKQPVLLQHGVLVDGMTWFLNPPEQNLPMILADTGDFDVWVVNTRGTRFSNKHVSLVPTQPEYWNWSWDELVAYDLPATIDFVYQQTGQKIHYVGHSLGTLTALASFSEGRLVDKLQSAALLSPIAYLSHMTTALGVAVAKSFIGEIVTLAGLAEFDLRQTVVADFIRYLCWLPGVDCYDYLNVITGRNCCLNSSTVSVFLQNEPQPTSVKNMIHLAQTVRYGIVAKYDYGRTEYNLQHYGETRPPVYNLSNIPNDLPLFLSYGGRDALSDVEDVKTLLDCLTSHDVDKITVQFIEDYAHVDFIMGTNAKDLVYASMIKFFNQQ